MKIRKSKIINSFQPEHVVSSATGKAQFVVLICNVQRAHFEIFK